MSILKWAIIFVVAAGVLAAFAFAGLVVGAVAAVARFLFFALLAGLVILAFTALLSHRRAVAREARSMDVAPRL